MLWINSFGDKKAQKTKTTSSPKKTPKHYTDTWIVGGAKERLTVLELSRPMEQAYVYTLDTDRELTSSENMSTLNIISIQDCVDRLSK